VGDGVPNIIRRFDAKTGSPIRGGSSSGVFVQVQSGGLTGPRGLFTEGGKLFVVNQNVNLPKNGEILRYKLNDGAPDGALVPFSDTYAPHLPRGMVNWKGITYVADFAADDPFGRLLAFDQKTGKFLREFSPPTDFAYKFHPRGLVIGPNGLLYVSNFPDLSTALGGQILVFDPKTLDFIGAFVVDAGGTGKLNRPEGLVFGPDGNLYITSFRADTTDTDSIRIYDGHTGVYKDRIDLVSGGRWR
jgi:DNA-binding beta-propeller fold protein YncE